MRAYRLAYDGADYHGFQRQPDVETVEGALLDALAALDVTADGATPPPGYAAAGRTDAGVSALAQTVAFEAPSWLTPRVLDGALSDAVGAWAHAEVPADFHATHDAVERTYTYRRYCGDGAFDASAAEAALARLSGEHDFHNLTPDDTNTVRTLDASGHSRDPFFDITATADGFPRQLVRRIVSVVVAVGRGERDLADVDRLLASTPVDGPDGVAPAPPEGLVLRSVEYPGVTFSVDAEAAASVSTAFDRRRARLAEAAESLGAVADLIGDEVP